MSVWPVAARMDPIERAWIRRHVDVMRPRELIRLTIHNLRHRNDVPDHQLSADSKGIRCDCGVAFTPLRRL